LVSSQKARELLGFHPDDPVATVTRSVRWHLQNPSDDGGTDLGHSKNAR
jgi:hypothetical protein